MRGVLNGAGGVGGERRLDGVPEFRGRGDFGQALGESDAELNLLELRAARRATLQVRGDALGVRRL